MSKTLPTFTKYFTAIFRFLKSTAWLWGAALCGTILGSVALQLLMWVSARFFLAFAVAFIPGSLLEPMGQTWTITPTIVSSMWSVSPTYLFYGAVLGFGSGLSRGRFRSRDCRLISAVCGVSIAYCAFDNVASLPPIQGMIGENLTLWLMMAFFAPPFFWGLTLSTFALFDQQIKRLLFRVPLSDFRTTRQLSPGYWLLVGVFGFPLICLVGQVLAQLIVGHFALLSQRHTYGWGGLPGLLLGTVLILPSYGTYELWRRGYYTGARIQAGLSGLVVGSLWLWWLSQYELFVCIRDFGFSVTPLCWAAGLFLFGIMAKSPLGRRLVIQMESQ